MTDNYNKKCNFTVFKCYDKYLMKCCQKYRFAATVSVRVICSD